MKYIKDNFVSISQLPALLFNKHLYLMTIYFFIVYIITSFGMYFVDSINIYDSLVQFIKASTMYIFNIVLPLGGLYYLIKNTENSRYINNLKYLIYPLFKIKIILYLLLSLFFIASVFFVLTRTNPELIEFLELFRSLLVENKINGFVEYLPYLKESNADKYTYFLNYFEGYKFIFSLIFTILGFTYVCSLFFMAIFDYLINDNTVLETLKTSANIHFNQLIYVSLLLVLFIGINHIQTIINTEAFYNVLLIVVLKSFSFSLISLAYFKLLNKEDTKIDIINDDDPYNINDNESE